MKRRATVPEEKPKRISRREKLTHHLLKLDIEVREKEKPFRTIVTTRIRRFEWGILSDSLAYGVFMDDTMVISSPGAGLSRLSKDWFLDDFMDKRVKRVAIMGGGRTIW